MRHSAAETDVGRGAARVPLPALVAVWTGCVGLVAGGVVGHFVTERPFSDFTRDVLAIAHEPFYVGYLQTAAVLGWWTVAAACGVCALALPRPEATRDALRLAGIGAFAGYLALDDAYLVHEHVLPRVGIGERMAFGAYVLIVAIYVVADWAFVRAHDGRVLGLAGVFFSVALVSDHWEGGEWHDLVEDGPKLLGIGTLALWAVSAALRLVTAWRPVRQL